MKIKKNQQVQLVTINLPFNLKNRYWILPVVVWYYNDSQSGAFLVTPGFDV